MRRTALVLCVAIAAALVYPVAASHAANDPGRKTDRIPSSYIVGYRPTVSDGKGKTDRLEKRWGFKAKHRYARALKGFAARLSQAQLEALRKDPDVEFVSPDRPVRALGSVPLSPGDAAPTGVRRIEAATTSTTHEFSGANVAVIDSGIDLSHPDLNAADGKNCVGTGPAQDDNGHGTHVAGSIAAKNNGTGVTGVAPGTKVYAAKVLDANGSGSTSRIICAIDWITATRTDADPANDIAVANMSLGGGGTPVASCSTTSDPFHKAVCSSTNAGVTYVVAAGNNGWDFDYASVPDVPAAYPEVLTVTAMADSDGRPGGSGGAPSCDAGQTDDYFAGFSNYAATTAGSLHTLAAPGSCIGSTYPGGGYATMSGTSMASPHVAGAVALCVNEAGSAGRCAGLRPADVIQKLRSEAETHTITNTGYGFAGDPSRPVSGRYFGYLTRVGVADTTPPSITALSPADGATGVGTNANVAVSFSEPMDRTATQAAFSLVGSADNAPVSGVFSWSGNTMTFDPSSSLSQGAYYAARVGAAAKDAAGNPLGADKTWTFKTLQTVTRFPAGTTIQSGSRRSGSYWSLGADDNNYYEVNSTSASTYTSSWYGRFTGVSNALRSLSVTYKGKNSRTCTQTVSFWRWTTGSWVQVDSRYVGTTEVQIDRAPTGTLADYVSGTSGDGDVLVRVRCTLSSASFFNSADLFTITYSKA